MIQELLETELRGLKTSEHTHSMSSVLQEKKKTAMSISIQDVSAEQLAKLFHHYAQTLASTPVLGKGSEDGGSWEEVSPREKNRLVAAARLALWDLAGDDSDAKDSRKYFAKPGEAEWGC